MSASSKPGFAFGFAAALHGARLALSVREVRRAYAALSLAVMLLAFVLDAMGITGVWFAVESAGMATWVAWLFKITGTLLVLVTAPILAVFLIGMVVPMLAERVFLTALRHIDGPLADQLETGSQPSRSRSMFATVRRFLAFVGATLLVFVLALIPGIGPLVGPAMQAFVASRFLGWELLEPYFEHRDCDYAGQRAFVARQASVIVGFSLPYSFALAIPLLGPLLFGVAQAAAAELVSELERAGVRA